MNVKVSIITATYNSSFFIEETYQSICQQTYTNWEWLVTDDASTDSTLNILREIEAKDSRVKVFQNMVNSGAAVSRNNSLDHVSGDYVAFIDSDDLWHCSKLMRQLNFMLRRNLLFTFTAYDLINEESEPLDKTVDSTNDGEFTYKDMLAKKATLGCSTVIINGSILGDTRMPLVRTGQDYAFWLLFLKREINATIFPEVLTSYRVSKNSISRNKVKKAMRQWEIYRSLEKLSFSKSCFYFCFYCFRALFRRG